MTNPLGITGYSFEDGGKEGDQPLPPPPSTPTPPSTPPQEKTLEDLQVRNANLTADLATARERIAELTAERDAALTHRNAMRNKIAAVGNAVDQAISLGRKMGHNAGVHTAPDGDVARKRFMTYMFMLLTQNYLEVPPLPAVRGARGGRNVPNSQENTVTDPSGEGRLKFLFFAVVVGMLVIAVFERIQALTPPPAPPSTP